MDFKTHLKRYLSDENIEKLMNSLSSERTNSLVLNINKIDKEKFKNEFKNIKEINGLKNAFYYDNNEYPFGKNYLFDNGAYYIMDSASMFVSELLGFDENDLVLDMCSAPGGKTIYSNINNKNLRFISNDISHERCLTLSSNIEKLGFDNIIVTNFDFLSNETILNNTFDKIILDAPCSGSAMFRKNEDVEKDWSYEKVTFYSNIQKKLLNRALDLLKDGGELIYSTCSFSFEEDEENILYILKERDDVEIVDLPHVEGEYRSNYLKESIHFFPFLFKGEGQFIAKLKKKGNLIKKEIKINEKPLNLKELKEIKATFNLDFASYKLIKNKLYGLSYSFDTLKLPLIRYGVEIAEIKDKYYIPSFNLAHYLDNKSSIELNENEAKMYLNGQEIIKKIPLNKGYYTVSFNGINLGFIKYSDGKLKNLYPKGLRH